MPFMSGSITPSTALVAIAASTAEPPRDRISAPACEACTWLLATMPYGEITMERALVRSCANPETPRAISKKQGRDQRIFHLLSMEGRSQRDAACAVRLGLVDAERAHGNTDHSTGRWG